MELSEEQRILNSIWQERRYDLVALTESFGEQIERDQRLVIWNYVDHNELGIAFDHLLYVLFDEPAGEITVNDEQAERILALGKAMAYTPESAIVYRIFLERCFPDELAKARGE